MKAVSWLDGDVGGLYVIVYGWCWSITLGILLFSHIFHFSECITLVWCPSVFDVIEGDFPCPPVLAAWEIGANEVVSLLVWSRPFLSRWLRLLMLLPSVTVFHLHNLLCKYLSTISKSTLALLELTLWLRSKLCSIAAGRSFFSAVVLLSRQGVFILYHLRLVFICFALWDALDVIFRFVCPKLYLVNLGRPLRKSVSTLDSDVGGLNVIVYRWCWSITLCIPLFSHMFLSCVLFLKSEGGFLCPHVLTAWEIGVNEDRNLLVWGRHLQSRWLCLFDVASLAVTGFHAHIYCMTFHIN